MEAHRLATQVASLYGESLTEAVTVALRERLARATAGIEILPVDSKQIDVARAAYRDYGKGTGHPATLNFGDVFAYALATTLHRKLMCKGSDFLETDIAIFEFKTAQ